MKILFCGSMVPENVEYSVRDISAAGNRFQNNLIKNLKRAGQEVVACSFLGMEIPGKIKEDLQGNYVYREKNVLRSIKKYESLIKELMSDTEALICYNIIYVWLVAPLWAKQRNVRSIAILADYSEGVSYNSVFGKIYAKLQLWSMRHFDTVVGLSANIRNKLRRNQRFILMEGGIDKELYDSFQYKPRVDSEPITFMYSGLLNKVTGVDMLLDAMERVKRNDIRLLISGKGELEEAVRVAAQSDERITYLGHLPYNQYIMQLQEADVLVNPRNMELPENQNNFPSKIMDYLATGKPVISTRFVGWQKFDANIYFCESSIYGLKDCLEKADRWLADMELTYKKNRELASQFRWDEQLKRIFKEI